MKKGHDPSAVANKFIGYALDRDQPVWNVSVQKLMYFAHALLLIREERPLINGAFEAWEYGPVCRPVYNSLKQYGREPVSKLIEKTNLFTGETYVPEITGDMKAQDVVEEVARSMLHIHPSQLIKLSHVDGGAWSVVWDKSRTGPTLGNIISDSLTTKCYSSLKIALPNSNNGENIDEATPFTGNRSSTCRSSGER